MTREQIERAADVYAAKTSPTYTNGDYDCIAIAKAFEHGAQWVINTLGKMQPTDAWKEITERRSELWNER